MPKIRVSQSVSGFKERAIKTWGLEEWQGYTEENEEVLFFGLYTKHDYDTFLRHKGKKIVFWCGSDVLMLLSNYESRRIIKLFPDTIHWCENQVEEEELKRVGLKPKVCPSFLDSIYKYPVTFKPDKEPHIFLCGHANREDEYGWGLVERLAERLPTHTFHIYGAPKQEKLSIIDKLNEIDTRLPNIIYHGKVEEEQFNKEIQNYQCGLRTNEHDGFSEVIAKNILNGGYPISKIKYPHIWHYETEEDLVERLIELKYQTEPNLEGRSYYIKKFNQYDFNKKRLVVSEKDFYKLNGK